MKDKLHVSKGCAYCFGQSMLCSHQECLSECACGQSPKCQECGKKHCEGKFDVCSGDRRRRHKMASTEIHSAEEDPFFEDVDEPAEDDSEDNEPSDNPAEDDNSEDDKPSDDDEDNSEEDEPSGQMLTALGTAARMLSSFEQSN